MANLASENDRARELLIGYNFIDKLLELSVRFENSASKFKTIVWALGNICRGKNLTNNAQLNKTIDFWGKIIKNKFIDIEIW